MERFAEGFWNTALRSPFVLKPRVFRRLGAKRIPPRRRSRTASPARTWRWPVASGEPRPSHISLRLRGCLSLPARLRRAKRFAPFCGQSPFSCGSGRSRPVRLSPISVFSVKPESFADTGHFSLSKPAFRRIVRLPFPKPEFFFMSQHRSLKGQSTIAAKRNVLKRFERVEILKSRGQFKVGDKVIGLRKTKPND